MPGARQYRDTGHVGFDGVDFRGICDTMDITLLPAFAAGLADTARQFGDAGLQVSCISSGISICEPGRLEDNLAEAARTIPVARALGCHRVRVFGNGKLEAHSREQLADFGRDCLARILSLDGARDLSWMLETIALLRDEAYDGWLMFEHEKRWHPELEEPETIFPGFVRWIRPLVE